MNPVSQRAGNYDAEHLYQSKCQSHSYNNNYGKKKKGMSTLKKAAVLGAVAYGSYQIGKMSSGYGGWNNHPRGYGFNQWNRDREIDGFMCRKTDDCSWMDRQLYCQDYELDFSPSRAW